MDFQSIEISFQAPLKIKETYNAQPDEIHDNRIVIHDVDLEGYLGLVFESSKTESIETCIPVDYSFHLAGGREIRDRKEISLFRPELEVKSIPEEIIVDPVTGFVDNRIEARNIGKGTLIVKISTPEDSRLQIEPPTEERALVEAIQSDLEDEMSRLGKEFPRFQPLVEDMIEWEKRDILELSEEEREEYSDYLDQLYNAIASDREFFQEFVGAYAKVLIANIEYLELVRRFVRFYNSLVSKNILLINPFDSITVTSDDIGMTLEFIQTDRLMDRYEDVTLPRIQIKGKKPGTIELYNLFGWD